SLSGAPFDGPIGAAKVGYKAGQYLLNPTVSELADSELELVVAGPANAVQMVESEAKELSEDVKLDAVMSVQEEVQVAIATINALVAEAGKPKWDWQPPAPNEGLVSAIRHAVGEQLASAFQVRDKLERRDAISKIRKAILEALTPHAEANAWSSGELS